jgi:hypothetical protein
MKIQSDLNKLSEWCERNSLFLNVDKCKTITFSKTRYPVEFAYMLARTMLDRESYINDELGFIRRLLFEFRDPYTLKSLYTSLVRPKLEYASCVWSPFYDVRVDKVERVQIRFIRYALRGLGWTDTICHPMSIDVLLCALTLL